MKKVLFSSLVFILAIGLFSPGYSSDRQEIKIGVVNSLTGANVQTGSDQKWAYDHAVKDINAAGGVFVKKEGKKLPIRLIYEDDQSTPDGAASSMERLIKVDKVDFVLGSNNDKLNNAAATVADKYKIFFQSGGGWWGDDFLSQHFNWSADMFFTAASAAAVPFQIWDTLPVNKRPKAVAIMVMNIPDGAIFGKGVASAAKKHGYKVVDMDAYTQGTKDFSSSILKMRSTGADALLWLGTPPDSITLIRGIKAQNFNLKYIHGWMGFWPSEFAQGLGADSDYLMHDGFWSPALGTPGSKKLDENYRADHDGKATVSVGLYYAVVQVLAQAIERAGEVSSAKVKNEVWGGTFKGTTMGTVTYGKDTGYCETASLGLQWLNQKSHLVWPTGVSDYKFKFLPPWNKR